MKKFLPIVFIIHYSVFTIHAQEVPPATEQQLENLADAGQAETEDDSYLQQLEQFRKNPVNLNTADETELRELKIITDLQIQNLISYRKLLGKLVNIYELQAVPSWDVNTIRKILPFVTISSAVTIKEDFSNRFRNGDHSLLLRVSQVLEKAKGFDKSVSGSNYPGSPQKIFFRYRYTFKNLLQLGVTGDKDAGEHFFKGAQSKGFDFYSFHFFAGKIGSIEALAAGDFTVNIGQGLIQWQSLSFKKSSDVMGIKRQSAVLHPYNSAGEFNFHRGAGITIKKGNIELTAFASVRKLNANYKTDTLHNGDYISSFLTSGYNRTASEVADKNRVRQIAVGSNVKFKSNRWHIGVNGIYYKFSLPVDKADDPYNLYALSGDRWYNFSVDYSYTYKNIHFFGEAAADKNLHKAFINGLLVSVDPRADLSILHRHIEKEYQAINGNAFTENTSPSNEDGMYAGITLRLSAAWRLDAYADIYRFPWLKYLADAPGYGKDFLTRLTYTPDKQVEIYIRYRNETRQGNQFDNTTVTNYLIQLPRENLRVQGDYKINKAITIRNREEMLWYNMGGNNNSKGFLAFFDFIYKPLLKPYSGVLRLQYFESRDYNSRLYAYENDVPYSYSIPVFYDKGYRYYTTFNYDLTRQFSFWLRWAQTIYPDKKIIGSGLDEIPGNKKSEIKLQLRLIF